VFAEDRRAFLDEPFLGRIVEAPLNCVDQQAVVGRDATSPPLKTASSPYSAKMTQTPDRIAGVSARRSHAIPRSVSSVATRARAMAVKTPLGA
jgi:hypothetical protein